MALLCCLRGKTPAKKISGSCLNVAHPYLLHLLRVSIFCICAFLPCFAFSSTLTWSGGIFVAVSCSCFSFFLGLGIRDSTRLRLSCASSHGCRRASACS